MIEINRFEEVTQIKLSREMNGKPLYWVATYLVDGLLIDTGPAHTAQELVDFLEGQNVMYAINTHHHEDHIGGNYLLQQQLNVRIYAHSKEVPVINQTPKLLQYQVIVWGNPRPTEVLPAPSRIRTDYFNFDVVETPGHTTGHVAVVEAEKGWCFTGDLFVTEKPKAFRPFENVLEIIESMRKLTNLPTKRLILFTGIGRVILDGRTALGSCADYLEDLSRKVRDLAEKGLSVDDIRDQLIGKDTSLAALTEGDFSARHLINSILRSQNQTGAERQS
jgi:glyoxylase-like metal-dependent hydrolase (beta-lactamase superfamily II)